MVTISVTVIKTPSTVLIRATKPAKMETVFAMAIITSSLHPPARMETHSLMVMAIGGVRDAARMVIISVTAIITFA